MAVAFDTPGKRAAVMEHDGTTRSYTYDALFRLTGEQVTGGGSLVFEDAFTHDPVGNRLERTHTDSGGTTTTTSTYDERDRLLTQDGVTRTWDDNGNLTATSGADGATYTWDAEDRLIRVETAEGEVVTHAYDADGNRVRTEITPATGPPAVTAYLVDPSGVLSHVVAETDAAGDLTAYYVRGDDLLAVLRPTTGPRYYHADGLGSIRALTDDTATVTDRYTFTAFGELHDHQGTDENAYLFAGEPLDPNSGFYYLRARWMDPDVGRFVSMDPFGGSPSEPLTLHKYLYTGADPVNKVDPSGLTFSLPSINVALAIRGTLSTLGAFVFDKAISVGFNAATGQEVHFFETSDLISLIPLGGIFGVIIKRGAKPVGRLFAVGHDVVVQRIFVRTFGRTGGQFVRVLANHQRLVLTPDRFRHIINRHVVDFWDGSLKRLNTMWPRGTSASRVVRYLDEAVRIKGSALAPGTNDVLLSNGIRVRVVLSSNFEVITFHPLSGPGVFDLSDLL